MSSGVAPLEAMRAALAKLKADPSVRYAEVRFVDDVTERLKIRDLRVDRATSSNARGVAIRVLGTKTWGFSCTSDVSEDAVMRAADRAVAIAKASASVVTSPVLFPERAGETGTFQTPVEIDPFSISIEKKLAELEKAVSALRSGAPASIRTAEAWMDWTRLRKHLLTTEGTDVSQDLTYGGCGMHVYAVGGDGRAQRRSYPTWQGGDGFQAGYEKVGALDLAGHANETRDEALALLTAPACPNATRDLILESSQMALQIHESCGHPTELDRALGTEISLAGGSFMQPNLLGSLRYGSREVDLVADATSPGGMGTFGWDDEGTRAGKHALVRDGMFVDYLSSRESAAALGRASTGTMRADGWNRTPIIRMTNVSLEPKRGSLDDLIADTKDGVYFATDKSWSIDDLRLNFQFSCEIAWEIKNGKRMRILRDPFYTGITPEFWRSCDAVCGPEEWKLWGVQNCGKGDPMQIMQVGHGAAPARFKGVSSGSSGQA
ncbi:MAG: TldD/PmbA family protein [Polyangiaceae bacterium]